MKRITDPDFRYTSAAKTDLRKTFARIKREQAERDKANLIEVANKVKPIIRAK